MHESDSRGVHSQLSRVVVLYGVVLIHLNPFPDLQGVEDEVDLDANQKVCRDSRFGGPPCIIEALQVRWVQGFLGLGKSALRGFWGGGCSVRACPEATPNIPPKSQKSRGSCPLLLGGAGGGGGEGCGLNFAW